MADLDFEGLWKETLVQLRNYLGEEEFSGWFSDMKYLRCSSTGAGNSIIAGIPSAFHRDKVSFHYKKQITSIFKKISGQDIDFDMEVIGKTAKTLKLAKISKKMTNLPLQRRKKLKK